VQHEPGSDQASGNAGTKHDDIREHGRSSRLATALIFIRARRCNVKSARSDRMSVINVIKQYCSATSDSASAAT
jgi:hypothetical protein